MFVLSCQRMELLAGIFRFLSSLFRRNQSKVQAHLNQYYFYSQQITDHTVSWPCTLYKRQRPNSEKQQRRSQTTTHLSSVAVASTKGVMRAVLARCQKNRQERARKIKRRRLHMMAPTPSGMQLPVARLTRIVQRISFFFGQRRPTDQQVIVTNLGPISYMIKAKLTLPEIAKAHQAICVWNISTHI